MSDAATARLSLSPSTATAVSEVLQRHLGNEDGDCAARILQYLAASVRVEERRGVGRWAPVLNSGDMICHWSWGVGTEEDDDGANQITFYIEVFYSRPDGPLISSGGWSWRPHRPPVCGCPDPFVCLHGEKEAAVLVVAFDNIIVKFRLSDGEHLGTYHLPEWHHRVCGLATENSLVCQSNQGHIHGLNVFDLETFKLDKHTIDIEASRFLLSLPGCRVLTISVGYIGASLNIRNASGRVLHSLNTIADACSSVKPMLLRNGELAVAIMNYQGGYQSLYIFDPLNGVLQHSWSCQEGSSYYKRGRRLFKPMRITELLDAPDAPAVAALNENIISLYHPDKPVFSWRTFHKAHSVCSLPNQWVATICECTAASRCKSENESGFASASESGSEDVHESKIMLQLWNIPRLGWEMNKVTRKKKISQKEDQEKEMRGHNLKCSECQNLLVFEALFTRSQRKKQQWRRCDECIGEGSQEGQQEYKLMQCDLEIDLPAYHRNEELQRHRNEELRVLPGGRFSFAGVLWKLDMN